MSLWQTPSMPATAVADAALERVSSTIAVATGLASAGRAVDLSGMQQAAGALCAQVLDLRPEDGRRFRRALLDLHGKLATLEAAIRLQAGEVFS